MLVVCLALLLLHVLFLIKFPPPGVPPLRGPALALSGAQGLDPRHSGGRQPPAQVEMFIIYFFSPYICDDFFLLSGHFFP